MKTQKSYTAIMLLLALLFAIALQASTALLSENLILLDGPPEIELTSPNVVSAEAVDYYFEEEEYVNDIPFDTKCVSTLCKYNNALKEVFVIEEEAYVDDIPFETEHIAAESLMEQAMKKEYLFEEEAYIDDIPFDTYAIAKNYNYKVQFAHYE
jgi:hypothetical protein